ncbi:unnamed protein product [Prorocentrum cordatum]|uniref:Uncharacterized protein n=1 Tax=Prorocentrum cordatum TaxID=2364126 RepID=A0ABN9UFZ6_9DINO|nr:unnamed protein product [Polarella glacialis]
MRERQSPHSMCPQGTDEGLHERVLLAHPAGPPEVPLPRFAAAAAEALFRGAQQRQCAVAQEGHRPETEQQEHQGPHRAQCWDLLAARTALLEGRPPLRRRGGAKIFQESPSLPKAPEARKSANR